MKKVASISFLALIVISVCVPYIASARTLFYIWEGTACTPGTEGPTEPCGLCDALVVGRNIIEDMFKVSFILATVFIAYGGFTLMIAGGSEKNVTTAKGIIQSAVVGLLIALTAWLLINTIITSLANGSATVAWNSIECGSGSISGPKQTIGGNGLGGNADFTGKGGQFGGAGANGSWTDNNSGATQAQINRVVSASCAQQVSACINENKKGSNENPELNITLEAAYQIACKKAGTGYNAQLQFKCLTPVVSPWKKCSDGLPDLSKICK